jgi:mannose-6-phosphate isomerase-like protein (cupin superfamily)
MTTVSTIERTEAEPLRFLGNPYRIHVDGEASRRGYCLVEAEGPAGNMPPLHVHHEDDEAFYVLEGRLKLFVGNDELEVGAGRCGFAPRGVPHTYRVGSEGARWLLIGSPAGFDAFVREVAKAGDGVGPAELPAISARYGIEILGPPGMLPAEL